MPNIFKRFSGDKSAVKPYQFPDAAEIFVPLDEPEEEEESREEPEALPPESDSAGAHLDFAKTQYDAILQGAQEEAREILLRAREEAQQLCEEMKEEARAEGYQRGFDLGMKQAAEDAAVRLREESAAQAAEVQAFLEQAGNTLDHHLDSCVDELRDLALAVAEKVVSVSLKSSGDVIGRMIQTAIDRRKRREWVRIYISESDAKRMAPIPASLNRSLAALSDRVRLIPMADEEPGTCIIETPNEILDASASTQLNNIRSMLSEGPTGGFQGSGLF